MKIQSFRVTKFRNVVDSGEIEVDPKVTCLVGKNEAGKSGLLEALYRLNPAYSDGFDLDDQYPRWLLVQDRKAGNIQQHRPITAKFTLDSDDKDSVTAILGEDALAGDTITVSRSYNGQSYWGIPANDKAVTRTLIGRFPETLWPLFEDVVDFSELQRRLSDLQPAAEEGLPTAVDIAKAKATLQEAGLETDSLAQGMIPLLTPRLPKFFLFTSYSLLPGRLDFQQLAAGAGDGHGRTGLETARALLRLAGTEVAQLSNDKYEVRKSELEAVQIELTRQVFEYWKQNPDLEVSIDVDKEVVPHAPKAVCRFLDIRLRDKRSGYSNNFRQRSSGFQWFFSFLAAFSAFENEESPIVLLDEPALTLHGRAQGDFLRFINERLAPTGPVIYTTHSPFMLEPDRLERVRIVEDHGPPKGATSSSDVLASDPDSLFPLQAALGYDIAQNLFIGPHNLLVEGTSDFIYVTVMSKACIDAGHTGLDARWRVLRAGGATNIPTFVSLIGAHLDVTVLADSDTKGMQRINNMVNRRLLAPHRLVLASVATDAHEADIEDLFTESEYLKLYNKAFCRTMKAGELPPGDRIVKRIEAHEKAQFDHGKVAEVLLRHPNECPFSKRTVTRFAKLLAAINETLEK